MRKYVLGASKDFSFRYISHLIACGSAIVNYQSLRFYASPLPSLERKHTEHLGLFDAHPLGPSEYDANLTHSPEQRRLEALRAEEDDIEGEILRNMSAGVKAKQVPISFRILPLLHERAPMQTWVDLSSLDTDKLLRENRKYASHAELAMLRTILAKIERMEPLTNEALAPLLQKIYTIPGVQAFLLRLYRELSFKSFPFARRVMWMFLHGTINSAYNCRVWLHILVHNVEVQRKVRGIVEKSRLVEPVCQQELFKPANRIVTDAYTLFGQEGFDAGIIRRLFGSACSAYNFYDPFEAYLDVLEEEGFPLTAVCYNAAMSNLYAHGDASIVRVWEKAQFRQRADRVTYKTIIMHYLTVNNVHAAMDVLARSICIYGYQLDYFVVIFKRLVMSRNLAYILPIYEEIREMGFLDEELKDVFHISMLMLVGRSKAEDQSVKALMAGLDMPTLEKRHPNLCLSIYLQYDHEKLEALMAEAGRLFLVPAEQWQSTHLTKDDYFRLFMDTLISECTSAQTPRHKLVIRHAFLKHFKVLEEMKQETMPPLAELVTQVSPAIGKILQFMIVKGMIIHGLAFYRLFSMLKDMNRPDLIIAIIRCYYPDMDVIHQDADHGPLSSSLTTTASPSSPLSSSAQQRTHISRHADTVYEHAIRSDESLRHPKATVLRRIQVYEPLRHMVYDKTLDLILWAAICEHEWCFFMSLIYYTKMAAPKPGPFVGFAVSKFQVVRDFVKMYQPPPNHLLLAAWIKTLPIREEAKVMLLEAVSHCGMKTVRDLRRWQEARNRESLVPLRCLKLLSAVTNKFLQKTDHIFPESTMRLVYSPKDMKIKA